MLNILSSRAPQPNETFVELPRAARENNLQWIERALKAAPGDGSKPARVLLVGGVDTCSFRLRVAQSHLRDDLTPSFWSHVALLGEPEKSIGNTAVYEISLQPTDGFGFPTASNGVQRSTLGSYRSARDYPNLAVISIPVELDDMLGALNGFQRQRAVLDAVELLIVWLAYAWGVGRSGNPLLEGRGLPSAAMLEVIASAAGIDLTPGLESRSSCPEAIWQSARWWHDYYEEASKQRLSGAWHASHFLAED